MERSGVMGRKNGVGKDTGGLKGGTESRGCGVGNTWPVKDTQVSHIMKGLGH